MHVYIICGIIDIWIFICWSIHCEVNNRYFAKRYNHPDLIYKITAKIIVRIAKKYAKLRWSRNNNKFMNVLQRQYIIVLQIMNKFIIILQNITLTI